MLAAYQDWKSGHTPVTTGRAPWLPSPFLMAMHHARSSTAVAEAEWQERMRKRRQAMGGPGAA